MNDLEEVYREFRGRRRQYLRRHSVYVDDTEYLLQDIFLRVMRNEGALSRASNPIAWLIVVAKTALIDHHRRNRNRGVTSGDLLPDDLPNPGSGASPVDGFSDCLWPLVEAMPDDDRILIRFMDIDGGRQVEYAKTHGLAISTVTSRVQRVRKRLRQRVLSRCEVGRDIQKNIAALSPGACRSDCC